MGVNDQEVPFEQLCRGIAVSSARMRDCMDVRPRPGLPLLCAALWMLTPGSALALFGSDANEGEDLWVAGDQYLRLVRREESSVQPHQHPQTLAAGELYQVLLSLEVQKKPSFLQFSSKKARPVFTAPMAQVLAANLSRGLAQAGPEEELIFVLAGFYKGSLLGDRRVVGGRVFFNSGRLHLLFGDVLRSVHYGAERDVRGLSHEVDRRLYPFYPGSRERQGAGPWKVLLREGIRLQEFGGETRPDWLALDLPLLLAGLQQQPQAAGPDAPVPDPTEVPPIDAQQQQRLLEELRQQRVEMARMRKQMRQMQPGQPGQPGDESLPGSLSERLQTLKALREQELVSEEEYQDKRQELLDGL